MTQISCLIQRGQLVRARTMVDNYPVIDSIANIQNTGQKCRNNGTILHISKAKTVAVAKSSGSKMYKREVSYHWLVFCRLYLVL